MRTSALSAITVSCLAGLLVLSVVGTAGGRVAVLTPSDMGIIQNPGMPNDSRLLLRFEPPPELREARVDLAVLEFTAAVSCPDNSPALTLDAFALTSSWDGQNVEWNQGWDTPGGDINRGVHALWTVAPSDSARIRFDVTDMMDGWLRVERDNCGLMTSIARGEAGVFSPPYVDGGAVSTPKVTIWYTPRVAR